MHISLTYKYALWCSFAYSVLRPTEILTWALDIIITFPWFNILISIEMLSLHAHVPCTIWNIPTCMHNMPSCMHNISSCKYNMPACHMTCKLYLWYANMHTQYANIRYACSTWHHACMTASWRCLCKGQMGEPLPILPRAQGYVASDIKVVHIGLVVPRSRLGKLCLYLFPGATYTVPVVG